ncbi:hypothetical protein RFI_29581 [Reticulomyxa filosa]|uniref:Uncharacterized protein n=1 Tax=Reticulomyxa filosa TaxID=46433 RepID=X6M0X6_RETFI|nr:hypothetical protein RFI_29581 [Reticulomyxa filosa]|eukprot:ETO07808.1 hypothetical protein RFI_29581 [Reticulomyxa filosa]
MEVSLFEDVCSSYKSHLQAMNAGDPRAGMHDPAPTAVGSLDKRNNSSGFLLNLTPRSMLGSHRGSFSALPFVDSFQKDQQKLENLRKNVCKEMFDLYKKYFDPNYKDNVEVAHVIQQVVGFETCQLITDRMQECRMSYTDSFAFITEEDNLPVAIVARSSTPPVSSNANTNPNASANINVNVQVSKKQLPRMQARSHYDSDADSSSSSDNNQTCKEEIPLDIFDVAQQLIFEHMENVHYQSEDCKRLLSTLQNKEAVFRKLVKNDLL